MWREFFLCRQPRYWAIIRANVCGDVWIDHHKSRSLSKSRPLADELRQLRDAYEHLRTAIERIEAHKQRSLLHVEHN